MTRRRISTRERVAIFSASDGRCHICGARIMVGEAWDVEHVIPLAQGGDDAGDNLRPAHSKCHRGKSAQDATDTARAKRREARHIGAKVSRNPLPFGRGSNLKRKLNGTVVPRKGTQS